jgi:hypothetical protein
MSNNTAAKRHRTKLHVLRDREHRAKQALKRGLSGAAQRVAAHVAARAAYRQAKDPA